MDQNFPMVPSYKKIGKKSKRPETLGKVARNHNTPKHKDENARKLAPIISTIPIVFPTYPTLSKFEQVTTPWHRKWQGIVEP